MASRPHRDVLTTGEVARICNVAPRTVAKWFDRGELNGYRIPGSRDRRVPLEELLRFMKLHGMPTTSLEGEAVTVVALETDPQMRDNLANLINPAGGYELILAATPFEFGVKVGLRRPRLLILDVTKDPTLAASIISTLRASNELSRVGTVVTASKLSETAIEQWLARGANACLQEPLHAEDVEEALGKALAQSP